MSDNLISVRRTGTDGLTFANFCALFRAQPRSQEVTAAQNKAGYAPQGYGMPHRVHTKLLADGTYQTLWSCAGSCD